MSKARLLVPATGATDVMGTTLLPGPISVTSAGVNVNGFSAWLNVSRAPSSELAVGFNGLALTTYGADGLMMVAWAWIEAVQSTTGRVGARTTPLGRLRPSRTSSPKRAWFLRKAMLSDLSS